MEHKPIMTDASQAFLEKYLNNAAPTGYEWEGQKLWMDYLKPYVDTFITDTYGCATTQTVEVTSSVGINDAAYNGLTISQNYPNPFNPETQIRFSIGNVEQVKLIIYDMMGRQINTLINGESFGSGYHVVNWRGVDNAGNKVYGQPSRVIRSADSLQFGLSPIPDKEYKVWFFAYVQPTKLNLHNDILVFPDMYASVLSARARYYVWQFKDSAQAAAFALDDYKKGLKRSSQFFLIYLI